ncbi:hypothetical protein BJ085DRAFT_42737 [Dimargaris cristalligena]|uniref:ubiquitinyl hydrolase 1 n=1 Tax=Dimargaris cristalligena TaxID=215637 RepID=A0A4P9ZXL5_9FUNG|nr:hypothetical protein BJ085DRAFT_42737 [Dimargaris cristalligena]|eukprot:RKP38387.1 hypothetical protein BJ085DRAFT_42737 [Dimargaris cristalligena]
MNSIVQCLSATVPLARYFMDGSYRPHLNRTNPLGTQGVLAESFAVLVRTMWSGQYSVISPVGFREAIGRFAPQFKGDDQQDSQELLVFLLDGLHEDLNLVVLPPGAKPPAHVTDTMSDQALEALPVRQAMELAWEKHLLRDRSVVVGLFQGQIQSRLRCITCGQTSTTYAPFTTLSVPVPSAASVADGAQLARVTLAQCLESFVQEEILDGDDQWFCPRCQVHRRTSKRLVITRLPDVLIIHLKRFSFSGPFRNKLETDVDFPVRGLNMDRFIAAPLRPPTSTNGSMMGSSPNYPALASASASNSNSTAGESSLYDLYAVSNHYGSLTGGHYTAHVRNGLRDQWYLFDDSRVLESDETKVKTKAAYNLFYVRNTLK